MVKSPRITLAHLKDACADQRRLFRKVFPQGAPLTAVAARKALAAGLDVSWLARILPAPARAEYDRADALARAEYGRVRALALLPFLRAAIR